MPRAAPISVPHTPPPSEVIPMMENSEYTFDVTQLDFEEKVLAASMQQPVLVDFWAPWCGPCKQLGPVLEKIVAEYQGRVLLAKVNADNEMQLASLFGIRSLPTVMLLRDGQPVDGFLGAQPESAIRAMLAPHLGEPPAALDEAPAEPTPVDPAAREAELRTQLAATPDNGELKLELAALLLDRGEVEETGRLLDSLTPKLAESDLAKKLRAQMSFAGVLREAPARNELEATIAGDPAALGARHQLGTRLLLAGEHGAAFEQFLEIMRRDRKFQDDLGRKSLVAAFSLVDDPDTVAATRRKMASMLF